MANRKTVDRIVLLFAVTLSAVVFGSIIKHMLTQQSMPFEQAKLMAGLLASILSIISLYIGTSLRHHADGDDDDADEK